jgi:Na+/melibiose symporter-like transporter
MDPAADTRDLDHYKVGTLSYTKVGLFTLFLCLLWGDFCFTLMEAVVPSILPLKFNGIGAPNWVLGLVLTTIPNLMNLVINPYVSFCSDRCRSKWGRRIPFLAGATPFLVIFLTLLGYSEAIGRWVHEALLGGKGSETTVLIVVIGVLMVCFQFFNLFVTSVYYYVFNDVVPQAFLARFMSLFKMVSVGAGSFYNFYVFKYANAHMQQVFTAAGLLYLAAFAMMCWKVKEGEYPPPPPNVDNRSGLAATVKTYAKECFTHRFYWYFFLASAFTSMGWGVTGTYEVLIATKIVGVDLGTFGKVGGLTGIISLVLLYPAGMVADRFHPLRVFAGGWILILLITPLSMAFLFLYPHMRSAQAIHIWISLILIAAPIRTLAGASEMPMGMRLLPRERYGQFCSASALVRSVMFIMGGTVCGVFLDFAKRFGANPNDCYRFVSIWNFVFISLAVFFLCLLYREWQRLGGMRSYEPPRPSVEDTKEITALCEPVT